MKKKSLIVLLLFVVMLSFAAAACNNVQPTPSEGPETGLYYYAVGGREYTLALGNADKFLLATDKTETGTYKVNEARTELTLVFSEKVEGQDQPKITEKAAELTEDSVRLDQMLFLRKIYYTVSFEGAGTTFTVPVLNGETVSRPLDPVRPGEVLVDWYRDPEFKTPFIFRSDIVRSALKLYARWAETSAVEFEIGFDMDGVTANPKSQQTIGGRLYSPPPQQDKATGFGQAGG